MRIRRPRPGKAITWYTGGEPVNGRSFPMKNDKGLR
jgi:hypothetical protein